MRFLKFRAGGFIRLLCAGVKTPSGCAKEPTFSKAGRDAYKDVPQLYALVRSEVYSEQHFSPIPDRRTGWPSPNIWFTDTSNVVEMEAPSASHRRPRRRTRAAATGNSNSSAPKRWIFGSLCINRSGTQAFSCGKFRHCHSVPLD